MLIITSVVFKACPPPTAACVKQQLDKEGTDMEKNQEKDKGGSNHFVPIQIDHKPYKAPRTPMTGAEIRQLAEPAIGADRDLFRVVPGPADDVKVGDQDSANLEPGMHFYSAPKTINPGGVGDAAA